MTPSRRVGPSAIVMLWSLLAVFAAGPAAAQISPFAQDAALLVGLPADNLTRSPSLAGMGRLTLVGEDPHHRITLWDFAQNPTGVGIADSVSTLDVRPNVAGASDVRDLPAEPGQIRETFAGHGAQVGYEFWRRQGRMAYGAIGDLSGTQLDVPYSDDTEHRNHLNAPWVVPVLNSVMPFTHSGKTRYALDVRWGAETVDSHYRRITQNAAGDFLSLDSETLNPPNVFVPEEFDVRQLGAGAHVSQVFAPWLTAAVGYDGVAVRMNGANSDKRNESQTHEQRPYNMGQATLIGKVGKNIDWGVDGRAWKAASEASWDFTISSGQGAAPLSGRGKLMERQEEGTQMRSRAIWHSGNFDVGAGWNTNYSKVTITPPAVSDRTSFNYFLNTVFNMQTADSLALPDSVSHEQTSVHAWEFGGGVGWHLPSRRGMVGVEYHRGQILSQTLTGGLGPKRVAWDARAGGEYRCLPSLIARAGYQFQWDDHDDFTAGNEYRSNLVTGGIGFNPEHSKWRLDLSYGIRWLRADYGDPGQPHGSRQQLASQVHWSF